MTLNRFLILLCIHIIYTINAIAQTSSKTPAMGWASWNQFGVNISENVIKGQADAMVSSGLAAVGFQYLNIDDGFFYGRNADGTLKINPTKFPNGMKSMADYIHSKGLKAGFYSDAGANTCGYQYSGQTMGAGVGLYEHDQQDCDLIFKTWGFDYYKVDYCGGLVLKLDEETRYTAIKQALNNTGREVNLNVCRWQFPGTWVTKIGDSWRMSRDINFVPGSTPTWSVIMEILDLNTYLAPYCSPGHYNDMDMLEVGRGLSLEEDKSHFSLWCILSSPLLMGHDMTKMSAQTKTVLTNTEIIALNQDTTGLQAQLISGSGTDIQVWAKNLHGKQSLERGVVLFNRTDATANITVKWSDLNLEGSASVRDLWAKADKGIFATEYTASVPSHGVVALKIVGTKAKFQEVFEAEYAWLNNFNLTVNTGVVGNQARAAKDANCSRGAKASYIGGSANNYLEQRDIFAPITGKYNLSISYLSGENRNATVRINGKDTTLSGLNSGGWGTVKTISFPITLNKGSNTIRIFNTSGFTPDIDKLSVDVNKNIATVSVTLTSDKSNYTQGESITLTASTVVSGGTITKVDFYDGTTLIGSDASSPYTVVWNSASKGNHTITAIVTDNFGVTTSSGVLLISVNTPQAAFGGTAWPIPGKIEFENFDVGGNGVAYLDSSAGTSVNPAPAFRTDEDVDIESCTDAGGGYNIGYTTKGEWLEYTVNVATAGKYDLTLRVACNGDGRTLSVSAKDIVIASNIAIPNTAGWQTWQDVKITGLNLDAGVQVIRVSIGTTDYINLNYMTFVTQTAQTTPILLKAGWNIIGCPISGSIDIETALSSIWANIQVVKDLTSFYDKSQSSFFNSLTKLNWGKGYLIKVDKSCELRWNQ